MEFLGNVDSASRSVKLGILEEHFHSKDKRAGNFDNKRIYYVM